MLKIIRPSKRIQIFDQLQLEEALFRTDQHNWLILSRSIEEVNVVLGLSGKPDEMTFMNQVQKMNIGLIRRFSGGGTVLIDKDTLFFTFICNTKYAEEVLNVQSYPRPIMEWVGNVYSDTFRVLGMDMQLKENDMCIFGKKFGGNAQSLSKDRWIHHTSLLWNMNSTLMANVLRLPKKQPEYREHRMHQDFLISLKDVGVKDPGTLFDAFESTVLKKFTNMEYVSFEDAWDSVKHTPHRKSTKMIQID